MRTTAWRVGVVLALAIVGVLAAACSHEDLTSGTEALTVKYTPDPTGVGRYERASFTIATIRAIPADPELAAIYGNRPLLFRFSPFTADMTLDKAVSFAEIGLSPGVYNVALIEFSAPQLVDENVSSTPATCIEGIAAVPSGPAASQVPQTFSLTNPSGLTFTVRPGQTKLSLTVDIPGLVAGFEGAFTCQADCGGGRPCLTTFNAASYSNAILANVTLQ